MVQIASPAFFDTARLKSRPSTIVQPSAHFHQIARFVSPTVSLGSVASVPVGPAANGTSEQWLTASSSLLAHEDPAEIFAYRGPDPYVDYNRSFTPEDGIAITYKTVDENGWRTAFRVIVLLAVIAFAITYVMKGSPYPMIPRGCPVFGSCAFAMHWDRYWVDAALLIGFGILCAWILFAEVQVYREIEIRPDCMILDGGDVYWAEKFELGWPQFVRGEEGVQVLTGVYGTRHVEFLTVKAFDEFDRGPAVFAAHLTAAMQQQWSGNV